MTHEDLPDGVLDRVRALLAKAESTSFDSEAEAFTAKAQELMTRYRIEHAVLDARAPGGGEQPVSRRVLVPDPYAKAKAILVANIARANGCSAVWSKSSGFSTVFGFPVELDAVDTLFASLLVQATGALRRQGSKRDHLGRSRTKRFRRSFLLSFAVRIGQRLDEAVTATVHTADAELGTDLVPVLANRADAARAACDAAFPRTSGFNADATDYEGWSAGKAFADQAQLRVDAAGTGHTLLGA